MKKKFLFFTTMLCVGMICVGWSVQSMAETDKRWNSVIGVEAVARQKQWILENEERKKKLKEIDLPNQKPEVRPCAMVDVVGGMWKRVYFKESPEGDLYRINSRQGHFYLTLDQTNFYGTLRSGFSIDDASMALKNMTFDKSDQRGQKYVINEGEEKTDLILSLGKTPLYTYRCTIVTKPSTVFLEGDMVLHGHTNQGNSMLYELYRRWF